MRKPLVLAMLGMAICSPVAKAQVHEISDYVWHEYGGHSYAATFAVGPWVDAQAEAEAIGGNLVAINDSGENDWLTVQFDGISTTTPHSSQLVWIGYHLVEGVWAWVNGDPVTFENLCGFCFTEPGPHMYLDTASHDVPGAWNNNSWHDIFPDHYLHGVIELPLLLCDLDGDGVCADECEGSNLSEDIVIAECETSVPNQLLDAGCTMADLLTQCGEGANNHGAYVSCVAQLTQQWNLAGIITGIERRMILNCAAQAEIP